MNKVWTYRNICAYYKLKFWGGVNLVPRPHPLEREGLVTLHTILGIVHLMQVGIGTNQ